VIKQRPHSLLGARGRKPKTNSVRRVKLVQRTKRFGGLFDLYFFECRECGVSHAHAAWPKRRFSFKWSPFAPPFLKGGQHPFVFGCGWLLGKALAP
jgi:hypothetical protein